MNPCMSPTFAANLFDRREGDRHRPNFDELVARYRASLPIVRSAVYLDSAGLAPLSNFVSRAIQENLELRAHHGKMGVKGVSAHLCDSARACAAELLRAQVSEIALMHNTTEGLNVVAQGFPWRPGDNLLIPDNEFPANVYPWYQLQSLGVEIRRIPARRGVIAPDDLIPLIDKNTQMLSMSHVDYCSGYRADIAAISELCHSCGIKLVVDAAQSLGILDIDVGLLGIDALAASGWKWLLGPTGTGLLYVSQEMLEFVSPTFVGAGTMTHGESYPAITPGSIKPTADRFEISTLDIAALCGLSRSLELTSELGTGRIEGRVCAMTRELTSELRRRQVELFLDPSQDDRLAGIVSCRLPGRNTTELLEALHQRGFHCGSHQDYLRLAPHFFNTSEEIEILLETIDEIRSE